MVLLKHFAKAVTLGGLAFSLLPVPSPFPALVQRLDAQRFPGRLQRPPPGATNYPPAGAQTSAPAPAPAPPQPAGPLPPSMLEQPARPAKVQFSAQSLSIHADNSSLREILHQISQQTGMEVEGLGSDERVFGAFGPGTPQDVLNDLLNGIPYDVLMVGVLADGAPRQLVLSPASNVAASPVPPSPAPPANDDSDDAAADNDTPRGGPAVNPPRSEDPSSPPAGPTVQSPQALFQQLQQMRERQQEQQQQQPQQPPPQQ